MIQSEPSTNKEDRRRGRPAGKNRVPLSKEERRARNALYERERRNETAEVMAQLAEAALCDPQMSNAELLATVINRIQRAAQRNPTEIEDLKRINDNLENQIALLQSRLGDDAHLYEDELNEIEQEESSSSSSNSDDRPVKRPRKYRKLSKSSAIHNRKQTGKKIRRDTSESSMSNWTESDTVSSQGHSSNEGRETSSSDGQQTEALKRESTIYFDNSQVGHENVNEPPILNPPIRPENTLYTGELIETEDIRGVLSDLLNDNEVVELGLQEAGELTNWPVNLEDIFAGY